MAGADPIPPALTRAQRHAHRVRRRALITRAIALVVIVAGGSALAVSAYGNRASQSAQLISAGRPTTTTTMPPTTTTTTVRDPRNAIQIENAKPGTRDWLITGSKIGVGGYADHVSVQRGDTFKLYVSSVAPTFHVEAFRMGWYQGNGARLVWTSPPEPGVVQSEQDFDDDTRTITAPWQPSMSVTVSDDWVPGQYMLKLVNDLGQSYVPLTVRDDASNAPVYVMSSVTTWQAYNDWGGYSLYHGPRNDPNTRSKIVSFDRPYARDGAGDFLSQELGLITLVEHMGLDVAYTTNIDMHEHPELIADHKVLISLGHDEYWSKTMREGVEAARDKGVNIMFLGANALFRRIRLQSSPLGPDREEVNYRDMGDDTGYSSHPDEPTTSWREGPKARPESSLTGTFYECNPVNVDGVVANASSWVFAGTGLHDGDHLSLLIGTEYDRVNENAPTPPDIEVMLHSPLKCRGQRSFADAAYYTTLAGAGVFDSGTSAWVCKLYTGCPADQPPKADPKIVRITQNLLRVFATGPAGLVHPSHTNLEDFDQSSSSPTADGNALDADDLDPAMENYPSGG